MSDELEASAASNSESRSDLPPLRVHHLMLWMAATALLISGCISFDRWARNGPPIRDPFAIGALVLIAISVSGALCATGWGLYWRTQGRVFPKEPGQWLLVEISLLVLGLLVWVGGSFVMLWINEDLIEAFQLAWVLFVAITLLCTHLHVGWKRCDTWAWGVAVLSILLLAPFSPAFFIWAACQDNRQRRARHWTHWFGIALVVIAVALLYANVLYDGYF